jgi:hypothetical protein
MGRYGPKLQIAAARNTRVICGNAAILADAEMHAYVNLDPNLGSMRFSRDPVDEGAEWAAPYTKQI